MFLLLFIIDIDKITTKAHLQLKSESIIDKLTLNKYLFEDNAFTNEPEEPLKKKNIWPLNAMCEIHNDNQGNKTQTYKGWFLGVGGGGRLMRKDTRRPSSFF